MSASSQRRFFDAGLSGVISDSEEAAEHPDDVAVEYCVIAVEGDAEHGRRGVGSKAGQRGEVVVGVRDSAVECFDDGLCGPVEVARPGVVSKPFPGLEDVGPWGRSQALEGGKAGQETVVVGGNGVHLGLLQHKFGKQDVVGVAGPTPGEVPSGPAIPGQETVLDCGPLLGRDVEGGVHLALGLPFTLCVVSDFAGVFGNGFSRGLFE